MNLGFYHEITKEELANTKSMPHLGCLLNYLLQTVSSYSQAILAHPHRHARGGLP